MHQYLFFIGDFPIRFYGLVIASSIILSTGVAYFFAKQDGRWHKHILDMGLYCGLAGILGGRLWDVFFFDWHYYGNHLTEIFNVWQGGMAIQGGILGGLLAGYIYTRYHHIDALALLDLVIPAVVLGQAIGRCANLLNGDAFGAPTGSDFGIIYPSTTLAYHTYGAQPLWPAEVWEGQLDIVIFAILLIFKAFPHRKGKTFALYIFLYSFIRFMLEFLRGDYSTPVIFQLDSAQVTSVIGMIMAIILAIYWHFKYAHTLETLHPNHSEDGSTPNTKSKAINSSKKASKKVKK